MYQGTSCWKRSGTWTCSTGSYKWYYDRGKITQRDERGKAVFMAGIVFDITEKKETQMDLENKNRILSEMSSLDSLTRISNHRTLIERLKGFIAEAQRTGIPWSIAMVEIGRAHV